jgi:hypothetical protein
LPARIGKVIYSSSSITATLAAKAATSTSPIAL